jgi:hypothetical protein
MKKLMILSILLMICGFLFVDRALAGVIEDRSFKQRLRIRQGILSGELTPYEVKIRIGIGLNRDGRPCVRCLRDA